jgi:DNA-binding response OmpR family regulator
MEELLYFDDALGNSTDTRALEAARGYLQEIQGMLGVARKLIAFSDPRTMRAEVLNRVRAPAMVILDILNERTDQRISTDGRCGLTLAQVVCERWPQVPIIFLTLFNDMSGERTRAGRISSYRDFVTKGHSQTVENLHAAIERLLTLARVPLERGRLRLDKVTRVAYWREVALMNYDQEAPAPFSGQRLKLTPSEYDLVERIMSITLRKEQFNTNKKPHEECVDCVVTFDEIRGQKTMGEDLIYGRMRDVRNKLGRMEELVKGGKLSRDEVFQNEQGAYRLVEPEFYE